MLIGDIDDAESKNSQSPGHHEQHPGDNTATHTMKQPAKIDGELLRLRARKQHAEIQRMKKAAFTDPFQLVDKKPVHHRDLAGRPTETEKADLQPDQNSLGEADAIGARPVPI